MTENEAIKELETNIDLPFGFTVSDEASKIAIQALEEIQQYRVMEQKLQSVYGEHDGLLEIIVNSLVKFDNAPDKAIKAVLLTDEDVDKWEQLKSIDTVEEFKALKEKNEPYKPKEYEDRYYACKCGNPLLHKWDEYPTKLMPKSRGLSYCLNCGQKLDWE